MPGVYIAFVILDLCCPVIEVSSFYETQLTRCWPPRAGGGGGGPAPRTPSQLGPLVRANPNYEVYAMFISFPLLPLSLLGGNILLSTLISNVLSLRCTLKVRAQVLHLY
jgi:hypothetical protein